MVRTNGGPSAAGDEAEQLLGHLQGQGLHYLPEGQHGGMAAAEAALVCAHSLQRLCGTTVACYGVRLLCIHDSARPALDSRHLGLQAAAVAEAAT